MTFKEKIYDKIAALKLNFFTERQLFVRLNVSSQDEKREIKSALTELVADGVFIVSDEGKYIAPQTIGAKRGVLQGNRRGFCFFIADDGGDDVFIPSNALNGAMHKDKVFVKVGPADSRGRFEGGVVSILERGVGRIIGVFRKRADGCGFVEPDDKDYFRDVFIRSNKTKGAQDGQKVVAKIGGFEGGKKPFGEITEILGKSGNPLVEVLAITRAFGFDDGFEKSVKKEAQAVVAEPFDTASREDMRGLLTVTIDGDDAKDLDDAVSLVKTDDGYKLYVHIADVSNYVRHKSILDNEAFERGTSVYFPGNVLPMLPEELSNGACSLNPRVDRPALTVEMLIDADGNVKGHKIYESVINSDERMTYKNAGKILDGDGSLTERYKAVAPMIRLMRELAGILNKKRVRRGSVFFEAKESVIDVDGDGRVLDIRPYDYGVANSIIEEFMLAANETVAEFVGHMEYPFIYRVHETPSVEKMREFGRFMSGIGIKIKVKEDVAPQEIQKYMDAAENTEYKHLVNKILLRSMQKARYDVINKGHFGLAAKYYCHFTSPIRRYPDLVVHRIIKMMLKGELNDKTIKKMAAFCLEAAAKSSEREKAAESAERQCDDYYKACFMEQKVGEEYSGIISSVTSFGIFVELKNTVEGLVRAEWLPKDDYTFDEARYTVVGRKRSFSIGDKVLVRVESADRFARQVNFSIVE